MAYTFNHFLETSAYVAGVGGKGGGRGIEVERVGGGYHGNVDAVHLCSGSLTCVMDPVRANKILHFVFAGRCGILYHLWLFLLIFLLSQYYYFVIYNIVAIIAPSDCFCCHCYH